MSIIGAMRKLTLSLIPLLFLALAGSTVYSQAPNQVYLPLIAYQESVAWLEPDGGSIVSLALDPQNPDTVYAGTWGNGVFKSVDGGLSWLPASNGLGNLFINSLAVDPLQPNTLYAGTYKDGMYKSLDGGYSWFASNNGVQAEAIVYTIAIDPLSPNKVYIGTRGPSNNGGPPWRGMAYKSLDGGATWLKMLGSLGGENQQDWLYAIVVHPLYPTRLYAASHEHGPWRSLDFGDTWRWLGEGIDDSGRAIGAAATSVDSTSLYYGVWHSLGVYKSIDGGNHWVLKDNGIWGAKVYSLAVNPLQPDTIYLATFGFGVNKTVDGGEQWKRSGLASTGIFALAINPLNPETLYAATSDDGVYRSDDGGATWSHRQAGLQAASVTSLLIDPADPNRLFAGLDGGGVAQSGDHGRTWNEMNNGLEDKSVQGLVFNPAYPVRLYALTDANGMYLCDLSAGETWVPLSLGLPPASLARSFARPILPGADPVDQEVVPAGADAPQTVPLLDMVFAPSDPNLIYLATGGAGVYRSQDGGMSWGPTTLISATIWSLAVDPLNAQLVYAAGDIPGNLPYSSDGGTTWGLLDVPMLTFTSLALSEAEPGILYAGTLSGVYTYTASSGWHPAGLLYTAIRVIAPDPQHPGTVYAGTDAGAYLSTDGGKTWLPGPPELANYGVQAITFDPHDADVVYFSTTAHGILRIYR